MSREKPQVEAARKHPEEYQRDLNPNALAGQNIGAGEFEPAKNTRSAFDLKRAHRRLSNLTDDSLKQIRVLPDGTRLEQGATYVDLNDLNQGEFTAIGMMQADAEHCFVAKTDVPYHLWNVLIGVDNEDRVVDTSDMGAVSDNMK